MKATHRGPSKHGGYRAYESSDFIKVNKERKEDEPTTLAGEDYPALVAAWDNDADDVYDLIGREHDLDQLHRGQALLDSIHERMAGTTEADIEDALA